MRPRALAAALGATAALLAATPAAAHPLDEVLQQIYLTPGATPPPAPGPTTAAEIPDPAGAVQPPAPGPAAAAESPGRSGAVQPPASGAMAGVENPGSSGAALPAAPGATDGAESPGTLGIEVDLTPGAMVAAAFARSIDTDGDGSFGPAETAAHMDAVGRALWLTVDGEPVPVTVISSSYPAQALLAAGGGTVTILATAPLAAGAKHVEFHDAYESGQKTTVQMSVTGPAGTPMTTGVITHADAGRTIGVALAPQKSPAAVPRTPGYRERALAALREPLASPWALLVLIGVCALLGAFHALTPGHGKTMLAAYLVGTRGTPRHAVALGGLVTVAHTSSVLLLGTAVLLAGHYVLPSVLLPTLELLTGAIVLTLGIRIVRRRWHARHHQHHPHNHEQRRHGYEQQHHELQRYDPEQRRHELQRHEHERHEHERHEHERHEHELQRHEDEQQRHRHRQEHDHPPGWRGLAAMGLAGGLVPCPEALGILILAVGLHRTALGLAMIIAFSAGLAAILVGLGLLLVTARDAFTGLRPARNPLLLTRLPVVSAAVLVLLGAAMTVSGVASVVDATSTGY